MSHDATNWAIKQRGISPAMKVVLWHLCDCYNPEYGAFPSQEYLAEQCEVSRSALNVHLEKLERAGMIAREQRRQRGSMRQDRTHYYFPFEAGFADKQAQNPCPETGHGPCEAESSFEGEPSPENGESRVQNLDSNPVREPVSEPVTEREGAREVSEDDPKKIEREFKRWFATWPTFVSDSERNAREAWFALTEAERAECRDKTPAYIAAVKATGRTKWHAAGVYLASKSWQKLADPKSDIAPPSVHDRYSRPWMALRLAELCKPIATAMPPLTIYQRQQVSMGGENARRVEMERRQAYGWPRVRIMDQSKAAASVPSYLVAISETFIAVEPHSALAAAWRALHERMGWPWLLDVPNRFQLPAGDPEAAMAEFQARLNEGKVNDDAA